MAKKQYFENLLGAMQESILKAHSMIENQHLNVMKRYFDCLLYTSDAADE